MAFKPAPKPSRIEDRKVIDWVVHERDGCCVYGMFTASQCWGSLDPHHIQSKGSGGDDVKENLITLCRKHHREAQENKISSGKLRELLTRLFGYTYE